MSTRHPPAAFKDTQLIGWDSEPTLERESTSFGPIDSDGRDQRRRHRQRARGAKSLLVAALVALSLGVAVLLQMAHLLQRH